MGKMTWKLTVQSQINIQDRENAIGINKRTVLKKTSAQKLSDLINVHSPTKLHEGK
jgi:hypothetical protein